MHMCSTVLSVCKVYLIDKNRPKEVALPKKNKKTLNDRSWIIKGNRIVNIGSTKLGLITSKLSK